MTFDTSFFIAMVPAVILMGLAKGGFAGLGLLSLPLMSIVVSPIQAAAIMLPLLISQDVVTVWSYRREFDGHNLATLLPGAFAGVLVGYLLASRVPDTIVSLAVGLISGGFGLRRLLSSGKVPDAVTKAGFLPGTLWGAMSGFTSMIAHAGGPPFQIYALPQRLPPAVFVGTGAIFFSILNLAKVPPYIALGSFSLRNLTASLALMPVAIAATFLGIWLVRRLPPERFYRIIDWLLLAIGLKLITDGLRPFFG